jgi:gamma-glutamylcyclotransferase (GGCT)/AIG2-like uncharacterized protein YtfP
MPNVFTYGSLMFDVVWLQVIGSIYPYESARLIGYRRLGIKDELYPAVIPATSDTFVDGRLYFEVTPADIRRLDRFEGERYERRTAKCRLPSGNSCHAEVYVFTDAYRHELIDADWDPKAFEKNGLRIFLSRYKGFQ